MILVTPPAQDSPVAVSATTSPSRVDAVAASVTTSPARMRRPVAARAVRHELATPIGDGHLALMTASGSTIRRGAELDVQLTNGPVVTAVVNAHRTWCGRRVDHRSAGTGTRSPPRRPDPNDIVTVLAEPPVTIAFAALTTLDAEEGTPVLDDDGELIGLCSQRHGGAATISRSR